MPGPLIDCYVLAPERSKGLVLRFLEEFLPQREASFEPVDPYEALGLDPEEQIDTALEYLEEFPEADYSFYWKNRSEGAPLHGFVCFNSDGSLILGLSPSTDDDHSVALEYLRAMQTFVGTQVGLICVESPPPGSRSEFLSRLQFDTQSVSGDNR